jgi:hypothetical protein
MDNKVYRIKYIVITFVLQIYIHSYKKLFILQYHLGYRVVFEKEAQAGGLSSIER